MNTINRKLYNRARQLVGQIIGFELRHNKLYLIADNGKAYHQKSIRTRHSRLELINH
jgi:hypothetical protein